MHAAFLKSPSLNCAFSLRENSVKASPWMGCRNNSSASLRKSLGVRFALGMSSVLVGIGSAPEFFRAAGLIQIANRAWMKVLPLNKDLMAATKTSRSVVIAETMRLP